jgi:putative two-component system response regulator
MSASAAIAGRRILVVDDDPAIGLLLGQVLQQEGYQVARAADGREALAQAAAYQPDLVLLDLDMPRLGGFEVCRQLKQDPATRLLPVLILTGQSSSEARLRAWELGADDFLTKPFQAVDVRARCRSLLRLKGLVDELDSAQAVVFAFARAVEAKSPYTQGHAERVTAYALALARRVGISAGEHEVLRQGALLHDIGKISIPDAVLDKPGPLTAEEYTLVQQHPMQGVRILEPLRSVREAIPLIRWHHERPDGKGYPDGLRAEVIPPLVRILSVADVFDALSSARPYRPAMAYAHSMEVLQKTAAGGGLDGELVRQFGEAVPEASMGTPAAPASLQAARIA